MKSSTKIFLALIVLALAGLACNAITGNNSPTSGGDTGPEILFSDDFSSDRSGWDRDSAAQGFTEYVNGAYHIKVETDSYFWWGTPYQNFGDVIVEVDAALVAGEDDNMYGVICKHEDNDNWYALVISGDGYAAIRKRYLGGELEYITDFEPAPMVNTGRASNKLRGECVGDRLALYVNGELAIESFDADISAGDVGLIAGTFEQPLTEVSFDNFLVIEP
jgi:hypothetical protein